MEGNQCQSGRFSNSENRKTVIGKCSKPNNVVIGNSMLKANNPNGNKRGRQWDEKEGTVCGYSLEGVLERVSKDVERPTKCRVRELNIYTGCDPKGFKRVVSRLSDDKLTAIEEMGFGRVRQFRCTKLNLPLCRRLVENFDVDRSCINIHGRELSITEDDFDRLMGLRCRGILVEIEGSRVVPEMDGLKKRLFGDCEEIDLKIVKRMVGYSDDADDLFRVRFALFALATMFCPSKPGYVDPRFLSVLVKPYDIGTHNWARFAFSKIVEAVKLYQNNVSCYVEGCLLFLQLFYQSAIGEIMFVIPRGVPPMMAWGGDESKRLFERVEALGGFNAIHGIWVTRQNSTVGGNVKQYDMDYRIWPKLSQSDDMYELKLQLGVVEDGIGKLASTLNNIGSVTANLRNNFVRLQNSITNLKVEGISDIVSDVLKSVESEEYDYLRSFNTVADDEVCSEECEDNNGGHDENCLDEIGGKVYGPVKPSCMESESGQDNLLSCSKLCSISVLSHNEGDLLNYIMSNNFRAADMVGSDEVGRYGDFSVSCWDVRCLCPGHSIRSEVINIMGWYLFANSLDSWFLPTFFSERAQSISLSNNVEGYISSTISLCRMDKYKGRLHACKKMFIPIYDEDAEYWFLVVANMEFGKCEIWDSTSDSQSKARRAGYVAHTMDLLKIVFAGEVGKCLQQLLGTTASQGFTYPESNPIYYDKPDSGIFVIRNMQYYRQAWYGGFDSGDQRIRLVLEIVNNPLNECADAVWKSVEVYLSKEGNCREALKLDNAEPSVPTSGVKFKPRVPPRW